MDRSTKPFLRSALVFLFLGGLIIMLWPAGQSAYGWWSQRTLRSDWEKASEQPTIQKMPSALPQFTLKKHNKSQDKVVLASENTKVSYVALPPTRIVISDIHVDAVVVQGMDSAALQRGPGHDPTSVLPGQTGNCVLAAHSNIFGAWFGDLDQLWAGSIIELHTKKHVYTYSVLTSNQVSQNDVSVLAPTNDGLARLTLITCTKPASTYRHVITALLDESK